MSRLAEIVADLAAEHAEIDRMIRDLPPEAWDRPTHAPGWAVRDQVAHLAFFDEQAALSLRDPEGFRANARAMRGGDPTEPAYLSKGRAMAPAELLAWWREASSALVRAGTTASEEGRVPWYGPDMSPTSSFTARLMECWSHGLDIEDVIEHERPRTERLRHVAFISYRTRAYAYSVRGMTMPAAEVRVELTGPNGEQWAHGPEAAPDRISGPAEDFCMVCTQRRHVADTDLVIEGEAAAEWMSIAQAFAGPPGQGRQPGQFRPHP
ncbi:MAG: TIGR03084 family protein [Dehalococcoidia bacterium]|nr:TIGR03084 family protein [Dehalococcoidia bacterium]